LNKLYGYPEIIIKDWDFIVEKIITPLKLGNDWGLRKTKHGNPKLKKGGFVIDLIALDNIHSIKRRKLKPNINNYLNGVPLTIQSLAFDVNKNILWGRIGIKSILTKTVGINNKTEYKYELNISGNRYSIKRYEKILGLSG